MTDEEKAMANGIDLFFLQRELHTLRLENAELKVQIEKMKCYGNCKHGYYGNMCTLEDTECCENCKNWELAE